VHERRNGCRFCDLVWRAVRSHGGRRVLPKANIFLTWEIDGRQIAADGRLVNRTRRIRLSWQENDGKIDYVYLVFVAPIKARRLNSDAYTGSATDVHFLGRGPVDSREKHALMKSWIDLCSEKHGPGCHDKHGTKAQFKKLIEGTYFGVIDVVDMQLKALPMIDGEPEQYVAISYVWGKPPVGEVPYTTTRSNVMIHIQHGGLEMDRLPKTIQDAIHLVSRLGERYVWIDSLCIVQDSPSSWELNAKAMHLVYGNAYFTICAADGDATTGLRAIDPILRTAQPGIPQATPHLANGTIPEDRAVDEGQLSLSSLSAECLPGVRLLVSRPPEAVIQDSLWNQRGWTFQERLLSRRCLIFAEGQVYFQCRSAVISQDIFTDGGGNGWTNSPLRTLSELRRKAFWFYMKCIQLYTGRDLTKPKDVLTAFQGTAWLLEQHLNAPFLYGLPASHFDLALLWMPLSVLNRRRPKLPHRSRAPMCTQDELGNCNCKLEEEGYGGNNFPSWSWCGWMGGKAEYQPAMIEGCLLNVREWLRNHTWILWYVRDHEGNLRPLWDRKVLGEDLSEEARWKGYAGKATKLGRPGNHDTPDRQSDGDSMYSDDRKVHFHIMAGRKRNGEWSRQSNAAYLERLPTGYYEDGDDDNDNRRRESTMPATPAYDDMAHCSSNDYQRPHPPPPQPSQPYYQPPSHAPPQPYYQPPPPPPPQPSHLPPPPRPYYQPLPAQGASLRSQPPQPAYQPPPPQVSYYPPRERGISSRSPHPQPHRPGMTAKIDFTTTESDDDVSSGSNYSRRGHKDGSTVSEESSDDSRRRRRTEREGKSKVRYDVYGRHVRPTVKQGTEFTAILPDNPFGIIRGPFSKGGKEPLRAMPILQFWTWRTEFYVTVCESPSPSTSTSGLCQCNVVDKTGDWCGSIVLPYIWIKDRQGQLLIFTAMSDAKSFTSVECPVWNYYIPKDKDESEWDLYYVFLLERNRERALWERVGVGKVFQAAFGEAVWDEIKLG
jgi:hypothetical protein